MCVSEHLVDRKARDSHGGPSILWLPAHTRDAEPVRAQILLAAAHILDRFR